MQFSPPSCHLIPLQYKYPPQHRSQTPSVRSHKLQEAQGIFLLINLKR
jgi:hypothetical protein